MLLPLLLLHITAIVLANPFHKYPYVFLLDVGNEELEKVNTEQIRVSKQGGSLALRYPAIGYGENIAHLRVSGVDFGTDLKASIVDGGPGYQYVVIVLIGNPGVSFDAVITIQTLPRESDEVSLQNIDKSTNDDTIVAQPNDANDSAEDLSESEEASQVSVKENAEFTQESSNVYSYAVNEALSGYGNGIHDGSNEDNSYEVSETDDDENDGKQQDINIPYTENDIQIQSDTDDNDEINDESLSSIENEPQEAEVNNYPTVNSDQNFSYENQEVVKTDFYEQYGNTKENPYDNEAVPFSDSQRFTPDDTGTIYIEEPGDNESLSLDEILNDDYDNEDDDDDDENRQYSGKNNNYFIDRNDGLAVAY